MTSASKRNRPLRIAMIGQQGIPARHGGVERVCEELGARLVELGHEVTMFNSIRGPRPHLREYRGIKLRYVPSTAGRTTGNLTLSALSTLRVLFGRYDVVHFHAMGPCVFTPLIRLRPRRGLVATIHGRDDRRAKWGRAARTILNLGARLSARMPDEVIVVSQDLQMQYSAELGRATVHIPNGVSLPPAPDRDRHPALLDPNRPYLLALGRLVPEKAFDEIIAAFREVPGDIELAIIGGSSHTDDYSRRLAELAAEDRRVHLLGRIYGPELHEYLSKATAFVIASHLEGMPLTLLEASVHGLPLICSDLPVHLEVLGEDAGSAGHRVFATGDVAALTSAIKETLGDLELERLGAARLRERVLERYTWERQTADTVEVYERAIARRRVRRKT